MIFYGYAKAAGDSACGFCFLFALLLSAMRAANNLRSPIAALSRGIAGLRGATLIVNLPGSPDGAAASLSAVMPALKLGVESLRRHQRQHS